MDDDEVFALIVACAIAFIGWWRWQRAVNYLQRRSSTSGWLRLLMASAPAALVFLVFALKCFAAHEVRDDIRYIVLFTVAGAAWLTIAAPMMLLVGIDLPGDAIHRANPASAAVGIGAMLGITTSFAGANAGEGATIWTTFYPAAISLAAIFALWFAHQLLSDVAYAVSIERDIASGIRLGGMLLACGIILARAGAGDWISADATLHDFLIRGWPAIFVVLVMSALHRLLRPTAAQPCPNVLRSGWVPAIGVNLLAIVWACWGYR